MRKKISGEPISKKISLNGSKKKLIERSYLNKLMWKVIISKSHSDEPFFNLKVPNIELA